ncbi:MAG: hypothetical protein JWP87_2529, partial [Labilithrix sp.]|nr:hypothetical protein [Labilithrix sp.]
MSAGMTGGGGPASTTAAGGVRSSSHDRQPVLTTLARTATHAIAAEPNHAAPPYRLDPRAIRRV